MKHFTRCIVLIFFFSVFLIFGTQHSLGGTNSDSLTYIGHAFVEVKTSDGIVIYIDPYAVNAFADSADIVLITHEHGDHNELSRVKQKSACTVIRASNAINAGVYQSFTIGTVKVKAVPAYNPSGTIYHAKGSCFGYVVEFNGIKLYHAGDTGNIPEMADLASQNLDYALLPMEGIYTVTPEVATQMAATINAKHDIPIHTMAPPDTYSDASVARFTSPNKLVVHPGETIALAAAPTGVQEDKAAPFQYVLEQNYPNPFNPTTEIRYQTSEVSHVTLKAYDILGKEIATLVDEVQEAGKYTVKFNGSHFTAGVYFVRMNAGRFSKTIKVLLVK